MLGLAPSQQALFNNGSDPREIEKGGVAKPHRAIVTVDVW
jgi:hypothetical protein